MRCRVSRFTQNTNLRWLLSHPDSCRVGHRTPLKVIQCPHGSTPLTMTGSINIILRSVSWSELSPVFQDGGSPQHHAAIRRVHGKQVNRFVRLTLSVQGPVSDDLDGQVEVHNRSTLDRQCLTHRDYHVTRDQVENRIGQRAIAAVVDGITELHVVAEGRLDTTDDIFAQGITIKGVNRVLRRFSLIRTALLKSANLSRCPLVTTSDRSSRLDCRGDTCGHLRYRSPVAPATQLLTPLTSSGTIRDQCSLPI